MNHNNKPAILKNKAYSESSVFQPENLLREARRQMDLPQCDVPSVCVLDPDGDLADYLLERQRAEKSKCWACYHSSLYTFELDGITLGVIPCAVGASYAVLVAEQLFVSGCWLLISVTSAGMVQEPTAGKRFALITEAIRDEGTSYHYLPPEQPSRIPGNLLNQLQADENGQQPWLSAKSWTTDAPFRETKSAISAMETEQVTCVEMEAAALYAFAEVKGKNALCFAHLTNNMAQHEGDFEKGEHFGSLHTLDLLSAVLQKLPVELYQ